MNRRGAAALFAGLVIFTWLCRAQEPPKPVANKGLRYARVLVPQKQLQEFAKDYPRLKDFALVKSDEFWELIAKVNRAEAGVAAATEARIAKADWRASWSREQGLKGEARLEVVGTAAGAVLMPLEPLTLAIGRATWEDGKSNESEIGTRPALMGSTPEGKSVVEVTKSSTLTFPWTLRAKQGATEHTFELALPPAAVQQLILELPPNWQPLAVGAIIARVEPPSGPGAGLVSWRIEPPPRTPWTLTLFNPLDPASQPLVLVREGTTVVLGAAGIDTNTTLTLDVHHQPLTRLLLNVPPGVDLAAVRVGEKSLPWQMVAGNEKSRQATVDLPEPLLGVERVVTVQSIAPWVAGQSFRIPRLSLEGAIWQEGAATATIASTLQLTQVALTGGRQTGSTPAMSGAGETCHFQFFSVGATADLLVRSIAPSLRIDSLASLQLDPLQVTGTLLARVTAERGETFDLQLSLPVGWLIDALESTPADVIEDRAYFPGAEGGQTLQLRLKQSIRQGHELQFTARIRRRGLAPNEDAGPELFRCLQFRGDVQERRIVAVASGDPALKVYATGEGELTRTTFTDLSPAEGAIVGRTEGVLAFLDNSAANLLRLSLRAEEPRFSAAISVQALLDRDQIEQTFRVRIQPQGVPIHQVVLRASRLLPTGATWHIEGSDDAVISEAETSAVAEDESQSWRLQWKRARNEPFDLVARVREPLGAHFQVNWLSASEATAQTGTVEVGARDGSLLEIDALGAEAMPPTDPAPGQAPLTRAMFRFDPSRRIQLLINRPPVVPNRPALLVTSLAVASHFQVDGTARHKAALNIDNLGQPELRVKIPGAQDVGEWLVNGRAASASPTSDGGGNWRLSLPAGLARADVTFAYSTPPQSVGWLGWWTWHMPVPELQSPVLHAEWKVELPPGVQEMQAVSAPRWNEYGRRLLGPIWRSNSYSFLGEERSTKVRVTRELPIQTAASIEVCRRATCDAQGWAWFLGVAGLLTCLRPIRTFWLLVLVATTAAAALLLQPIPAVWASGALLGVMIAALLQALRAPRNVRTFNSEKSTSILPVPSALLLAFVGVVVAASGVRPTKGQAPAGGDANRLRYVIIPTNEQGEPEGKYLYVDPELLSELKRLATSPMGPASAWLGRRADYSVEFGENGLRELTATYQVETRASESILRLPFRRDKVHLLDGGVRVNREAIAADWFDESELRIPLHGLGEYVIEIRLRPVVQREGDYERLDLSIPVFARAQISATGAPPAGLEFAQALGSVTASADGQSPRAELGPVSRLQLRWPREAGDAAASTAEADQLVWWKIRPGAVTADARLKIKPLSGKLRELRFKLDPRLRLVAWDCDHETLSQRLTPEDGQWRLTLKRPAEKEVVVRAQFLLTGTSGVGNLVLPHLDAVAERASRAWVGFTTAPGWALDLDAAAQPTTIAPAEFLAAWGAAEAAPVKASAIQPDGMPRSLVVRPETGVTRYQSRAYAGFTPDRVALRWEASIFEAAGDLYELQLQMPPAATVQKVELGRSGMTSSVRFTQDQGEPLGLHLHQPLQAGNVLTVELTIPWTETEFKSLPELAIAKATEEASDWRIYRQSAVLVDVQVGKGWTAIEGAIPGSFDAARGRLLGGWRRTANSMAAALACRCTANLPEADGRLITLVQRTPSGWQAEVQGELEIISGQVDQVRLEIPTQWTGPFEVVPTQQFELRESSQPGRKVLLLRPSQPASGVWKFTIRGPLVTTMGEGVHAPDVRLLDLREVERLVVLPTRSEQQRIEWQISGLQAAELPEGLTIAGKQDAGWEAFRTVGVRYQATVKQVERFSGEPVVRLVDVAAAWTAERELTGAAVFDIEPSGIGQVKLALPQGAALVRARLGPLPARLKPTEDNRWQVELDSDQWPQRLEIVYRVSLYAVSPASAVQLHAPTLIDLRVERSLWTLYPPLGQAIAGKSPGQTSIPEQLLDRLERQLVLANLMVETSLTGESPENLANGFAVWQRTWHGLWNALAASVNSQESGVFLVTKRQALNDEYDALLRRLPPGVLTQELPKDSPLGFAQELGIDSQNPVCLSFAGAMPVVELPLKTDVGTQAVQPPVMAVFLGLSLLLALFFRRTVVREWLLRWPHVVVALIGLAWMIWLQPVWIGGLILVWAWWLAWRGWPGSQFLPSDGVLRPSPTTASRSGA